MVSVIGGAVLVICAFYYGIEKSRAEKNSLLLIEALYSFVLHIGQQIETFRTPLPKIYEEYFNEHLEKEGFLQALCERDLFEALLTIRHKLPKDVFFQMESFSRSIGGGYEKEQTDLCGYTAKRLEESMLERRELLGSRLKMYRLLPLLLALCVVILLL